MIDRPATTLSYEGNLLQIAANSGRRDAGDHARGAIDGYFNGLLRIEPPEDVATFAFAVADRVTGRLKVPTGWKDGIWYNGEGAKPTPVTAPPLAAPDPRPTAPVPSWQHYWKAYAIGFCAGAVFAAITAGVTIGGGR